MKIIRLKLSKPLTMMAYFSNFDRKLLIYQRRGIKMTKAKSLKAVRERERERAIF